jgi:hypothetical protein
MSYYLLRGTVLAGALLSATVPAIAQDYRSAPPPGDKPCLRQGYIYDYQIVPGNRSLVVTDLARHRFRLTFMGKCYDLKYQFGLRFKTFGVGGLSCVSRGDSVLLRDDYANGGQCIIRDVQYQTPEMDRADMMAVRDNRDRR